MSQSEAGIDGRLTSYADPAFSRFVRRAFLSSAGYDRDDLDRPVVGIVDTSSDYNTCHRHMGQMVDAVKRGVLEAGGLPFAFPTISLHEILTAPTTMMFRNLAAMDTEEMIRSQPMDAVVLLGGCDKTLPAQIMAALSANLPALSVVTGPMITGYWRGQRLGACTDCRRLWSRYRAGELSEDQVDEIEASLCFTGGTCMVMGTASTMACIVETMGLMLPGGATAPHASGERLKQCVASGRTAVKLARAGRRPCDIVTRASIENGMTVLAALGGSTNAIIHLLAIAKRAGVDLALEDFDRVGRTVPVLVDCKPAGSGYMEDFHHAGGVPALLMAIRALLDENTIGVTGMAMHEVLRSAAAPGTWQNTIRGIDSPVKPPGSLAVLKGSLAPQGAVLKVSAASPGLLNHRGPAVVFDSPEDAAQRIDDPALDITPEHVLILRNAGPVASGMPEAGSLPIPKYLARRGVKEIVRVSDGRMSGTAYGTIVLHCSPEAAVGGPLALVRDGDLIEVNVTTRRLDLAVPESEMAARRARFTRLPSPERGWRKLYAEHVEQAHLGADMDFL